jgi:type IV secretion system protein VirB2
MQSATQSTSSSHASNRIRLPLNVAAMAVLLAPCVALANASGISSGATCSLLNTVKDVLNGVSIVVVTIAIIFAGYQIAFAHKRITDVAPVFIGAILIGAAGQIASLMM